MDRRQFLSRAGFGTIGALAGLTALPAYARKKKKRKDVKGEYEGTVKVGDTDVPFEFDIEKQNKSNGKVKGDASVFGGDIAIEGRLSSGSSVLEFEGVLGNETLEFRGNLVDGGKKIVGTWKAIEDGEVISEGSFTVDKVDDNDD